MGHTAFVPQSANSRSLGCPGFPVKVGGVANSMRFSLQKTAHAALSSAANRKSGYARDDKGEGGASIWCDGGNDNSQKTKADRGTGAPRSHQRTWDEKGGPQPPSNDSAVR